MQAELNHDKTLRIRPGTEEPALWASDGAILYWEPHNQLDLPRDVCALLKQIEALHAKYTKAQMFESYDLKPGERPIIAIQPTVPENDKALMRSLMAKAATRLRDVMPPGWRVEIEVPESFQ